MVKSLGKGTGGHPPDVAQVLDLVGPGGLRRTQLQWHLGESRPAVPGIVHRDGGAGGGGVKQGSVHCPLPRRAKRKQAVPAASAR